MSGLETRSPGFRRRDSGEWESLARSAAVARSGGDEEAVILRELLAFRLAGAPYAIPVERVREIVRPRSITPMPRVPDCVLGVIALRGEIVQVLDLRMRLGLEAAPVARDSRVIVLHGDDGRVSGILVDAVSEVLRAGEDEFRPSSGAVTSHVSELCARGEQFVSIVDLDRVLDLDAG